VCAGWWRCVFWQAKAGGSAAPAAPTGNNGKFNIQTYNAISPVGLEKYDTVSGPSNPHLRLSACSERNRQAPGVMV